MCEVAIQGCQFAFKVLSQGHVPGVVRSHVIPQVPYTEGDGIIRQKDDRETKQA